MRWTDLPSDGEVADGGPSGLRRSEWEQLRQRLERLPAGHPSSPGGGTADDGDSGDDSVLDSEAREGRGRDRAPGEASEPASGGHGAKPDSRPGTDGGGRPTRRGGNDAATGRSGHHDGPPAAAGRGEPYRPWFASGEPAEPWFASGAQPGLIPPDRDRG